MRMVNRKWVFAWLRILHQRVLILRGINKDWRVNLQRKNEWRVIQGSVFFKGCLSMMKADEETKENNQVY